MEKQNRYNGFTNYETWAVSLWMSNDRAAFDYFRTLAFVTLSTEKSRSTKESAPEDSIRSLANTLRQEFEERSPVREHATVYADLMNAALSEVDWYELADNLLSDLTEDEEG
ncbi:MAG TPA: hypothetical protein VGN12_00925 [Pirellulales bacterium]